MDKPTKNPATFISFRTNPDHDKAAWVLSELTQRNIPVTPLYGGAICPYGHTEPRKARAWITKFLAEKIRRARILVIVCSAIALESEWVYLEYSQALMSARAIFLLWFGGDNPIEYFCPNPRWLTKRLPPCAVYLIDVRHDSYEGVSRLGDVLLRLKNAQLRLRLEQITVVFLLVTFFVIAMYKAIQPTSGLDTTDLKLFGHACLALAICAASFFYPTAYRIPEACRKHPLFRCLVKGAGPNRYAAMIFSVLLILGGVHLGPMVMINLGAVLWIISVFVRRLSISRALTRLERKGNQSGIDW